MVFWSDHLIFWVCLIHYLSLNLLGNWNLVCRFSNCPIGAFSVFQVFISISTWILTTPEKKNILLATVFHFCFFCLISWPLLVPYAIHQFTSQMFRDECKKTMTILFNFRYQIGSFHRQLSLKNIITLRAVKGVGTHVDFL